MSIESGAETDSVGLGPVVVLRHVADFLTEHHYPYHLRFGGDLTFAQLREQPSLLLGGSSPWTQLMTRNLRFSILSNSNWNEEAIVDSQTKQIWRPSNMTPEGYADLDYGILCRLFDKESGQIAMVAGGITTFATEGAASVFFDPDLLEQLIKQAPHDWGKKEYRSRRPRLQYRHHPFVTSARCHEFLVERASKAAQLGYSNKFQRGLQPHVCL